MNVVTKFCRSRVDPAYSFSFQAAQVKSGFQSSLNPQINPQMSCRYRMKECQTARRMLAALTSGNTPAGIRLVVGKARTSGPEKGPEPGPSLRGSFQGALDPDRVALAGHSFGASTVAALVAEDPGFPCAIALDPAWYASLTYALGIPGAACSEGGR